jgi:hypothetical protein
MSLEKEDCRKYFYISEIYPHVKFTVRSNDYILNFCVKLWRMKNIQ